MAFLGWTDLVETYHRPSSYCESAFLFAPSVSLPLVTLMIPAPNLMITDEKKWTWSRHFDRGSTANPRFPALSNASSLGHIKISRSPLLLEEWRPLSTTRVPSIGLRTYRSRLALLTSSLRFMLLCVLVPVRPILISTHFFFLLLSFRICLHPHFLCYQSPCCWNYAACLPHLSFMLWF